MKKICMVLPSFSAKGGIASVVSGYRDSELEIEYDIHYIETYCDGNRIQKLMKALRAYYMFVKELIVWRPDIIHIHSSFGASFYRKMPFILLSYCNHKPIINQIHGSEFDELYTNANIWKKKLVNKIFGMCRVFIILSEEWKTKFSTIIPKEKIVIIENYSHYVDNFVQHKTNNQVLFLGSICSMKGCFDIPKVVKAVCSVIPNSIFILAGVGEIDKVKGFANDLGISDNIIFPGWVMGAEKDKLLRESDVFFLPSYSEGMPMSILESMGYGMPIISTNIGGIPQIVLQNENGFLYTPGDTEEMAKGLVQLLNNEGEKQSFGRYSLQLVKEKYSLDIHLKKLESVYMSIL